MGRSRRPGTPHTHRAYGPGPSRGLVERSPFRVLVAGREATGDGEWGRDGEGVGRGRRARTAHPRWAYGRGPFRILVAGREATGDGELGRDGEGVGRGRRPRTAYPQGAYGPGLCRVLVAGR